jgi:hypothetical protein
MIDAETLIAWFGEMGWELVATDAVTMRARPPSGDVPFFVRRSEHWLMLAIVPVLPAGVPRPPDLARRLLAVNRDMRLAKLGFDEEGDVVLAAELPTESLDKSEVRDAAERMVRYAAHYRSYLTGGAVG